MKHQIYYFSGTGNSLSIVRQLKNMDDQIEAKSVFVSDLPQLIDRSVDRVGFVYPIHVNAVPYAMAEFMRSLTFEGKPYIYAIASHGGRPGIAGDHLLFTLKNLDWKLSAYYQVEMVNNTPKGIAPKMFMTLDWEKDITRDKVQEKLENVPHVIRNIYEKISIENENIETSDLLNKKGVTSLVTKAMWHLPIKRPKLNFLLDSEICNGCGICEKVCPVNRIKIHQEKPDWIKSECTFCYACFNYCPSQAIHVKHYEKKAGRYHYPGIEWEAIVLHKK